MQRTAMSAIIYEVLDMGTAIMDPAGQLASSGAGIPGFIGMMHKGVQQMLTKFLPKDNVFDGDYSLSIVHTVAA